MVMMQTIETVAREISAAVERLPKPQQEAVRMRYLAFPGATQARIATQMGVCSDTLASRLREAHRRLQEDLQQRLPNFGISETIPA